jgi:hypothetical protein
MRSRLLVVPWVQEPIDVVNTLPQLVQAALGRVPIDAVAHPEAGKKPPVLSLANAKRVPCGTSSGRFGCALLIKAISACIASEPKRSSSKPTEMLAPWGPTQGSTLVLISVKQSP